MDVGFDESVNREAASSFYIAVLVAVVVWAPLHHGGATHLGWTISRLLILAAFVAAAWRYLGRGVLYFPRSAFLLCWFALLALLVAGAFRAEYAYIATQWVMSYGAYAAVFFLSAHVARRGDMRRVMWVVAAVAFLEAAWGVGQHLLGVSRAHGTFFNPSYFGGYLAAAGSIVLARILFSEWRKFHGKPYYLPLLGMAWIVMVAGVLVSESRGAFLAMLAGVTAVGWSRFGGNVLIFILGIIFLVLAAPNPFRSRLSKLDETDVYAWSRLNIWTSSAGMIAEHPFGVGPGMYRYYAPRYAFPVEGAFARYGKVARKAHSSYLDLSCEMSPAAGILALGMGVYLLVLGVRRSRRHGDVDYATCSGVLAAVLVHAAVDSIHKNPPVTFLGVMSAGAIWSCKLSVFRYEKVRAANPARWMVPAFGLLAFWCIVSPAAAYYANSRANRVGLMKAGKWLSAATKLAPGNANYWYNRATRHKALWMRTGEKEHFGLSLEYLSKAMELNPLEDKYPAAYASWLARMPKVVEKKARESFLVAAVELYERCHEIAPYNPFYYSEEGDLRLELGQVEKAAEAYRKALRIEPNYLGARWRLIQVLAQTGKKKEAAAQYEILKEKAAGVPRTFASEYEEELAGLDMGEAEEKARGMFLNESPALPP